MITAEFEESGRRATVEEHRLEIAKFNARGFTLRRSMAFLKNQKAKFGSLLAVAGGATAFAYFYPYNRDVALVNLQINEADAATVKKIEDAFQRLQRADDCKSLLKKHLTNDVLDQLKHKKTKLGATLYDVIRSGIFNLDASVGVYAPDAESYKTFAALFDPIIEEYHGFSLSQKQPPVDLGEGRTADFPPLDPKNKYIVSTRIRCGRSIAGYPFNPLLTQDDYLILQQKAFLLFGGESCHIIPGDWLERKALKLRLQVKNALMSQHDDELVGTYYPLEGMSKEVQNQLIQDHFLFKDGDRHLQQANACNYWPKGRGIFHNKNKTFLVWVNEEDHVRMISMQKGSNVGEVLDRLIRGIKSLESKVGFSRDERLGWLTFCPTNLGSTIRASVHIKLPKISKRPDFKVCLFVVIVLICDAHLPFYKWQKRQAVASTKPRLQFTFPIFGFSRKRTSCAQRRRHPHQLLNAHFKTLVS
ncbi:putative arginine kinase F46H5.3 [Toxocara canis]|uniref:arginine kinase n=1 Tax=Toxocara canis TaxID=6265 RepID=A0A0B2VLN0_TOXCA|nr:putative arginine kinase F46H5.3 [Toxocara canis]